MENTKRKTKGKQGIHLSPEQREMIIRLHFLEGKSQASLAREFGVTRMTTNRIIRTFAAENDKSALFMKKDATTSESEEIKALRKENMELRKKLYNETMRADFYDTMIDVAEEMFGIEIRKKADTGQSKGCTGTSGTK